MLAPCACAACGSEHCRLDSSEDKSSHVVSREGSEHERESEDPGTSYDVDE